MDGDRSNALGDHLFAGTTDDGLIRRGVLAFDIAGSIPSGSTVTSVSLSMNMSRTISDTRTVELHVLLADWGEGTSNANANEGQGAPATPNDATWRHRFFDTIFWTAQGGDFSATVSASQSVGGIGGSIWSSAQMVADVQSWLDNPASNFGWLVLGTSLPSRHRSGSTLGRAPPPCADYRIYGACTNHTQRREAEGAGVNTVRLTWSGATSANIDIYRNSPPPIATVPNTGRYMDSTGDTGRARYEYRVCEAGTSTCSNDVIVKFQH